MARHRTPPEPARGSDAGRDEHHRLEVTFRAADLDLGRPRHALDAHCSARLTSHADDFAATAALQALNRYSAGLRTDRSLGCTRTGASGRALLCPAHAEQAFGRDSMTEHREAAERSSRDAQHNPVLSAEQSFAAAQVHALLAIEQRLGELLAALHPSRLAEIS